MIKNMIIPNDKKTYIWSTQSVAQRFSQTYKLGQKKKLYK